MNPTRIASIALVALLAIQVTIYYTYPSPSGSAAGNAGTAAPCVSQGPLDPRMILAEALLGINASTRNAVYRLSFNDSVEQYIEAAYIAYMYRYNRTWLNGSGVYIEMTMEFEIGNSTGYTYTVKAYRVPMAGFLQLVLLNETMRMIARFIKTIILSPHNYTLIVPGATGRIYPIFLPLTTYILYFSPGAIIYAEIENATDRETPYLGVPRYHRVRLKAIINNPSIDPVSLISLVVNISGIEKYLSGTSLAAYHEYMESPRPVYTTMDAYMNKPYRYFILAEVYQVKLHTTLIYPDDRDTVEEILNTTITRLWEIYKE